MAVHPITKAQFDAIFTLGANPMLPTVEHAWFANENNKSIGAVVFDKIDSDWAYVVLEHDEGTYRWVAGNTCIATKEEATEALKKRTGATRINTVLSHYR